MLWTACNRHSGKCHLGLGGLPRTPRSGQLARTDCCVIAARTAADDHYVEDSWVCTQRGSARGHKIKLRRLDCIQSRGCD